jgi:hypothetical protein
MSEGTKERWDPAAAAEVVFALLPFVWLVSKPALRALFAGCFRAIIDGARSTAILVFVDPATLVTTLGSVAKIALMLAPAARMLALSPRRRLAWLPLLAFVWVAVLGVAVAAITSALSWALLGAASLSAWFLVKRPSLRLAALLPWIVSLEPMLGHSPLSDTFWPASRIAGRCAENDGTRPVDLSPDFMVSRYYAVTPVRPDLVLLTGERRSFWVRREPGGAMRLGPPLSLGGNFWQGCVRDDSVWVTSHGHGLCEVPAPKGAQAPAAPICHAAPGDPELGIELDYVDALCPPDRAAVYSSQLLRGGMLELDPPTGATRWHPVVPGLNLQTVARRDGKVVAITTGRLVVFDLGSDRVIEEHAAGVVAMGIDICPADDAVVVTDFTGRVRLFELGADGRYELRSGAFLPAPRRIAFSPTCDRVVVASGNDREAFLLRRADLEVVRSWRLGPGIRDLVFVDEGTVAVADACTVNLLDASL